MTSFSPSENTTGNSGGGREVSSTSTRSTPPAGEVSARAAGRFDATRVPCLSLAFDYGEFDSGEAIAFRLTDRGFGSRVSERHRIDDFMCSR